MGAERILIVEDEPSWVELVGFWLKRAGYSNCVSAATGALAIEEASRVPPDVVLLDLVLPDLSGIEVCRQLRSMPALARAPIVLFTSHKREKVMGLESGVDYFVAKSDQPNELLATLSAAVRRNQAEAGTLARGEVTLKSQDRKVLFRGQAPIALPPKMFALLHVLVERSPSPVSRADLYRLVEGRENPGLSRALDVMLNRLRKALPSDLSRRIVNVKAFGYAFLDA